MHPTRGGCDEAVKELDKSMWIVRASPIYVEQSEGGWGWIEINGMDGMGWMPSRWRDLLHMGIPPHLSVPGPSSIEIRRMQIQFP